MILALSRLLLLNGNKAMKRASLVIAFFMVALAAFAQPGKDKVVKLHGKKYYLHIVVKGETVYGVARDFNIAVKDIVLENPKSMDGISPGDTLHIPLFVPGPVPPPNALSQQQADTGANGQYTYHKVAPKETLYSLTREYKVSTAILDSLNPNLKTEGLKAGTVLRIPNKNYIPPILAKDTNRAASAYKGLIGQLSNDTTNNKPRGKLLNRYNIAVILTFSTHHVDSLQISKVVNGTEQFPLLAQISADFYDGLRLALDSLAKQGFNTNLHVYNITMDSATGHCLDSILKLPELANMNLIIGPPYPALCQKVAKYGMDHQVPVVSPLSPDNSVIKGNSFSSKAVPSAVTETEQTADYIAMHNYKDNIILVNNTLDANENYFDIFKKRLNATLPIADPHADSVKVAVFTDDLSNIGNAISNEKYNVIIVPYQDAAFVTKMMNQLANSKYTKNDSLCVYGMHNWEGMDVLDPDNLDTLHLHFPSSEYIDYNNPAVVSFIKKYRSTYFAEPGYFAYQGFDLAYFYCSMLKKYGTAIQYNLAGEQYNGVHTAFNFYKPDPKGGLENKGIYILEYKNYTLVKDN